MRPHIAFPSVIKNRWLFILITGALLLLILTMQVINSRFWMHDFEVYYRATEAFTSNNKVYGVTFGLESGYYKYSPFALFLFLPLSILPFDAAKIIFFLLISAASISTMILSATLLQKNMESIKQYGNGLLFIVLGIVSSQVFRELHLGNVNMILLLLLLIMLWYNLKGKQSQAGILFALILFIKPHFLILVPLLLLRKQFRSLAVTFLALVAGILLPAAVKGFSGNLALHKAWLLTMQNHNESLRDASDNIYSLFFRLLTIIRIPITPSSEKNVVITLLIIVAIAFGWFVIGNILQKKNAQPQLTGRSFTIEFLLLIAMVPNLVITDSEHFLLSIPLILFLLGLICNKIALWFKIAVIIAIVLYGMNIHDLVGATASLWLRINGILGLGNLLLIGLSIYGFRRYELPDGRMKESNSANE